MEKHYKANIEYNKRKKKNAILLCVLLIICMLGTMSIFIATKQYTYVLFFGVFLFLPAIALPSAFKSYPTDSRDLLVITDKTITAENQTFKLKDVINYRVIIELPASKLDSENKKLLEEMKTAKPDDSWFGNFDIVVKDEKGKQKVLYTHIDHCIDALETMISLGIKRYKLSYSIKKNSVFSEYDFAREYSLSKEKEFQRLSAKERKKQLL